VALWTAVAVLASLNGVAAGALLAMLVGQMVPEAGEKSE
jgi:zinc transporter ZupT